METAVKEGKYIYCIMATKEPKKFGPMGIGGRGDELHTICFDDIAACVSNSPIIQYSVAREHMLAHEKAIEEVMREHTVLPVRFGTVACDEEKVRKILDKEHDKFKDLLEQLQDKKELGLKAVFKDNIYKEIVEKFEDIKRLKEAIGSKVPEKTYYQRIEIGKMVEQALEKEKEKYKGEILDKLSPLTEDIKLNNTYGERMIVNAAFLVNKDREGEFDQKVKRLDVKYSDKINFKYVGTLPPFNFVNLVIETGKY